jgi:hypothetical protein
MKNNNERGWTLGPDSHEIYVEPMEGNAPPTPFSDHHAVRWTDVKSDTYYVPRIHARHLELELYKERNRHIEDLKLCGKHGCVSYKELEQLLVDKNETANVFMGQVKKLQAETHQLKLEINACLDLEPLTIRVCEGGGPENLAASLALTMANVRAVAKEFATALLAHNYYWPRRRSHGGGQACATLACGHVGPVGAPCCQECAKDKIESAIISARRFPIETRVEERAMNATASNQEKHVTKPWWAVVDGRVVHVTG